MCDNEVMGYVMPVRSIKSILYKELESKFNEFFVKYDICDLDLIVHCKDLIKNELSDIATYDELDLFVRSVYSVTLEDWINSL